MSNQTTATTTEEATACRALRLWAKGRMTWTELSEELAKTGLSAERLGELDLATNGCGLARS